MALSKIAIRFGNALPSGFAARIGNSERAKRILRPFVNAAMPDEFTTVTIQSGAAAGLQIEIDPKQEKFYWTGTYEPTIQQAIVNTLRPRDVFWDVGAHAGFFTLLAARTVGSTGQVHAFEPNDSNRRRLASTVERNGFLNVVIHPEAVSDSIGAAEFLTVASSSMGKLGSGGGVGAIRVPTTTLDQMLKNTGDVPRLIKVDAEGAEASILRGAANLLGNGTTAWLIEVHDPDQSPAIFEQLSSFDKRQLDRNHLLAVPRSSA